MAKELLDLVVDEISLVDSPANPGAQMLIFKRLEKNEQEGYVTCSKCGAQAMKGATECPKCGAPMNNPAAEPPKEKRMDELKAQLAKAEADLKAAEELANEEQKKRETAETEVATLKAELAKAKQTPEEVEKAKLAALPAEVRKRLDEQAAEIAKMRDEREDVEFTKRASAMKLTATTAEKFAPVLKRLAKGKATAEDVAELERVLKAQAEQARQGLKALTTELGSGGFEGGSPDAESQMLAKARQLQRDEKDLSLSDAIAKVATTDAELYARYTAEKRGQA